MNNIRITTAVAGLFGIFTPVSEAVASIIDTSGVIRVGDFDGDDVLETVVSSPETDCGKGAVYVILADGTVATWTRDTTGVLGTAACDDLFGASLAVGDFDGDGYDDLAIAAPGANDTGAAASGSAHVLYGSATGLTEAGDQLWTLDTPMIDGVAGANDHWGDALAAGDFNCDGHDDLAVGAPRRLNGAVSVIFGSSGGLTAVNDFVDAGSGGSYGAVLVAGNFNGDQAAGINCDDLVVGVPNETVGGASNAGSLRRFAGGTAGLPGTPTQTIHQNSTDVADAPQAADLFGWRIAAARLNDDVYDDLLVTVPGDACSSSVGAGQHRFFGSSTGITATNNDIRCSTSGCSVYEDRILGCHSGDPAVYGTATNEVISLGMTAGAAWGGAGTDEIRGGHGDDVLFGGSGNDSLEGGPGRDVIIGGPGDDTIHVDLDCVIAEGEVIDGGPGTDTIRSHLSRAQLETLGVTIASVEQVVTVAEDPRGAAVCAPRPNDDGPLLRSFVTMTWASLTSPNSVFSTTTGQLLLVLGNNRPSTVAAELEFVLNVRGEELRLEQGPVTIPASGTYTVLLDLNDFIPGGINPSSVDPALLVLPVSAQIEGRARLSIGGVNVGYSYSPPLFGHVEGGTTVVLYRGGALHDTYHDGDLNRWRAGAPAYSGRAVLMGRSEAHGSLGIPGY